jgi:hypothetical protein
MRTGESRRRSRGVAAPRTDDARGYRVIEGRLRKLAVSWGGLVLLTFLPSCSAESDGAAIRKLMDRVGSLAEKKDLPGLFALITEDFADFEGRDRAGTEALVAEHFRRRYGIVVHLLHAEIGAIRPEGTATVEADVVLSSGGAEVLRKIVRFAGEFYKFKLELRKTPEGWRVSRAEWAPADLNSLFPESLPVLREFFPGASGLASGP